MNQIINLIWASHPRLLDDVITKHNLFPEEEEDAIADLIAALYIDDTFNSYTTEQLEDAIHEMLNEYEY